MLGIVIFSRYSKAEPKSSEDEMKKRIKMWGWVPRGNGKHHNGNHKPEGVGTENTNGNRKHHGN